MMKNIVILLSFISIFSCKKAQENISKPSFSKEISIDKNWSGDILISDLNFVSSIDPTCKLNTTFFDRSEKQVKEDDAKCTLSKIKLDYDKLNSINKKNIIGKLDFNTKLFIKNSVPKNNNADLSYQTTLYIEKNKTIFDSIIIYQSFNYSEALTVKTKYYYLDKNEIYLLDIAEDESGANVEKWEHYKINSLGKISLVKQKSFLKDNNVTETNIDFWKGSYNITTKIISQFDNKETDVLYSITVESNQKAILSIGADHVQDYWCEGEYRLIKEDNILHAKGKCDQDDMDDFYLKNENGQYFIKSKRFENKHWQQLLKK